MRKLILYIFISVSAIFLSCSGNKTEKKTETIDTVSMMIMQIQKCSKLYTAEYQIHKIITHDDELKLRGSFFKKDFDIKLPAGNRKVAIPMNATLKAYIDFNGFSEHNIRRSGNKIEIILPDPKVALTSSKIEHKEIKQYVSIIRSNFSDAELAEFEKQGRAAIIRSIPDLGILDMARESAARTLVPMIVKMGYNEKDITIMFRKKFSDNDLPLLIDKNIERL